MPSEYFKDISNRESRIRTKRVGIRLLTTLP